jgi:hypothetical protein
MVNVKVEILFIISILFAGCTRTSSDKSEISTQVVAEMVCYAYTENQDTIQLQITVLNDSVTGRLTYNLFEKDLNRGTLVGSMQGDTLFADYTFFSEGVESIREVAFVKNGEGFVEAFGAVEEQNNKIVFADHSALQLNDQIVLKPISCN